MNRRTAYLFLFLLIAAICLSPRFSFGTLFAGRALDIRIEDLIIAAGLVFWLFCTFLLGKDAFKLPPLFWPMASILIFGLLSIFLNMLMGTLAVKMAFFYLLKEFEFFAVYLFVFWCLSHAELNKKLIKYWAFFALCNVIWLACVLVFNITWSRYYGPNSFIEPQGPFPSGGFFLIIFIFLFNVYLFYYSKITTSALKKVLLFVVSVLPVAGVISSGSMASVIGLAIAILFSFILYFLAKRSFSAIFKIAFVVSLVLGICFVVLLFVPVWKVVSLEKVAFEYGSGKETSRIGILESHLDQIKENPIILISGVGIFGEAHSQYTRILLERGIIGLILFFWLIFSIGKISYRAFKQGENFYVMGLSAGLISATGAMLFISIPNDAFMTVKVAEPYWFFAAMAMGAWSRTESIERVNFVEDSRLEERSDVQETSLSSENVEYSQNSLGHGLLCKPETRRPKGSEKMTDFVVFAPQGSSINYLSSQEALNSLIFSLLKKIRVRVHAPWAAICNKHVKIEK